jgi:hypothetical protein
MVTASPGAIEMVQVVRSVKIFLWSL